MGSDFDDPIVAVGVETLGALFASGAATPVDALNVYLSRIERLNPALNAFLAIDREGAARDARASRSRWAKGTARSALDGAVIGVKANIAVQGLPWHAGIGAHADRIAHADAAGVSRLREAGAVIIGMLNMHEAGLGATNDNAAFGRCHNPYRLDFTPGGSSGGAGAAVAAGLCAAALGTDTLGSVRIPAAYCGVFGHKPTQGLLSTLGVTALSPTLDNLGVIARSAADCRAMLNVLAGGGARPAVDRPARMGVIGLSGGRVLNASVADALSRSVQAARACGADIALIDPAWDWRALRRSSLAVVEIEAQAEHGRARAGNPAGFSPALSAMLDWAAQQSPQAVSEAYAALRRGAQTIRSALAPFHAVLSPTTGAPAFSFDEPSPIDQGDFTLLANLSGMAATAFPAGMSQDGLPISVQVMSPGDTVALDWAARLARPVPPPERFRK